MKHTLFIRIRFLVHGFYKLAKTGAGAFRAHRTRFCAGGGVENSHFE
jgi:hypothetical protein